MAQSLRNQHQVPPVTVIESIPVAGDHRIPMETVTAEAVPMPAHLLLYPELGRGGMGRVHAATDRNLLRHVALKRLDKDLAAEPMYRDGFVAEAQMMGQLEHPNIVPVHELAISDLGVPYFTMKLVQGIGMDKWLRDPFRQPGSADRLQQGLEIFLKVCDAVAYAHHRGVVHRDLKAENIGQVYVMDWGLARLSKTRPASAERSQMEAQGPVGTPQYMSPEQARGNPFDMDERTDVFGLGALLYELLTGKLPWGPSLDVETILARARAEQLVPIETAARGFGVPDRICKIVSRAVAVKNDQRYPALRPNRASR